MIFCRSRFGACARPSFSRVRVLPLGIACLLLAATVGPLSAAAPQVTSDFARRLAPEKCIAYVSWSGLKKLEPDANPTEKWLGQPPIQKMLGKLSQVLQTAIQENPSENEVLNKLANNGLALLRDCSMAIYVSEFDPKRGFEEDGCVFAVIELKQHQQWATEMLADLQQLDDGFESTKTEFDDVEFLVVKNSKQDFEVALGIVEGHLVASMGNKAIEKTMTQIKTPAPDWISALEKRFAISKTFFEFQFNPRVLISQNKLLAKRSRIPDFLYLEEIESVSGAMGIDKNGFVTRGFLQCPKQLKGVLSILDVESLDLNVLAEAPKNVLSGGAIRLNFPAAYQLIQQRDESGYDDDLTLKAMVDDIGTITGLDFESEILGSFDGSLAMYNTVGMLMSGNQGVYTFGVNDAEQFAERFDKFNTAITQEAQATESGEVAKKETRKHTTFSYYPPFAAEPAINWCHVEKKLHLSVGSTRGLSSHLRRIGRTRGRLIDTDRFQMAIKQHSAQDSKKILAIYYIDIATAMELVLPVFKTIVSSFGPEFGVEFGISFDDLPGIEVLSNGVEANLITIFRTPTGFEFAERSTIPGFSSVGLSGVAAGLMLPAIQAARQAARRVMVMNNLRQLQLAVLNYEAANGKLPPAYSVDKDGKLLLSWRVHILPYLEQGDLYEQFHLDEPWDSEHNKTLIDKMPDEFFHPQLSLPEGKTTLLAVSGDDGVFNGAMGMKLDDIPDEQSVTASIVDVNQSLAVTWTKPSGFDASAHEDLADVLTGTWPNDIAVMVLCDGSTLVVSAEDKQLLRSLLDRQDGKPEDQSDLD